MVKCMFLNLLFIWFILGYRSVLVAQEKESPKQLKPVVVTATKSPVTPEQVGGSTIKVITSEDIETSQQTQVSEILKEVGGLDVTSRGGQGRLAEVFIRGADAKNTLILIDGIPMNDPASANRSANIGSLTLDNVDRIEVLSGAQSVLYGSNATAGVINIITKKGKDQPEATLGMMVGSYKTFKGHGSATGKIEKFNYSLALSATQSEGYSIANDRNEEIPHDGNTSEKDGNQGVTLSANVGYEIKPNHEISLVSRMITNEADLDDSANGYAGDQMAYDSATYSYQPVPDGDKKQHVVSSLSMNAIKLTSSFDQNFFKSKLSYSVTENDRDYFDAEGEKEYEYQGGISQLSWQGTFNFDTSSLGFGLDQMTETMESLNIESISATTVSAWTHSQIFLLYEKLIIGIGFRNDSHENFGSAVTQRLAPSYQINNLKLKASYGTGFLAPSLYQLHSNYGNTDLDPEKSVSWDFGFEHQTTNTILFGMTWFEMIFKDRIDWVSINEEPWGQYQQADGETVTNGLESFIAVSPSPTFSIRVDHTYNGTEDPEGEPLAYRPRHKLIIKSQYKPWDTVTFSGTLKWVGERNARSTDKTEDGELVDTMPAYTVINVTMTHQLNERLKWYVKVDNLTDENYEEIWAYATPGRSAYVGIKASF